MKEHLKRLLPQNRFARSASVLAGGTVAGQAIVVAASLVLTRLYTPEDFGVWAIFSSVIAILSVIASLRYDLAIPLPETDEEATNVAALGLFLILVVSVATAILAFLFGHSIATLLNTPELLGYLWLVPVGLAVAGVYQVLNYWAIRVKAFSAIAQSRLVQAVGMVTIQIAGFALGPFALLFGRVAGQGAGVFSLLRGALGNRRPRVGAVTSRRLLVAAKRYKDFPIYSSWAGLLNAGGAQVPPLFFAAIFGPAAAGAYMLAQRVINVPMTVVAKAVADAFLPNAVEAHRENRLKGEVQTVFRMLAVLGFPPAAMLFALAPGLFALVFGEEWREAGQMVRWLAPMLAIQFLINPLSRIFVVLERQRLGLFLQGFLFSTRVAALVLAFVYALPVITAVKLFSLGSMCGYLAYYISIIGITKINIAETVKSITRPFLIACVVLVSSFSITFLIDEQMFSTFFTFVISIIVIIVFWRIEYACQHRQLF